MNRQNSQSKREFVRKPEQRKVVSSLTRPVGLASRLSSIGLLYRAKKGWRFHGTLYGIQNFPCTRAKSLMRRPTEHVTAGIWTTWRCPPPTMATSLRCHDCRGRRATSGRQFYASVSPSRAPPNKIGADSTTVIIISTMLDSKCPPANIHAQEERPDTKILHFFTRYKNMGPIVCRYNPDLQHAPTSVVLVLDGWGGRNVHIAFQRPQALVRVKKQDRYFAEILKGQGGGGG